MESPLFIWGFIGDRMLCNLIYLPSSIFLFTKCSCTKGSLLLFILGTVIVSVTELFVQFIWQETLVIKEKQLQKFFKTGDHVKVIAGNHEGATGMIVKVQNNVITILSDTSREDVRSHTTIRCGN